jgi:hypothetical protein
MPGFNWLFVPFEAICRDQVLSCAQTNLRIRIRKLRKITAEKANLSAVSSIDINYGPGWPEQFLPMPLPG